MTNATTTATALQGEAYRLAIAGAMKMVRKMYPEVEYIAGVGFCGPTWAAATIVFDNLKAKLEGGAR